MFGELAQIIAIRPDVIVNDVQNNTQSKRMGTVDECAQLIRSAVKSRRCKQIHTIVTPAEPAWEIGYGHQFKQGDSEFSEVGKLIDRGAPRSFRCERSTMHFVNHLSGT